MISKHFDKNNLHHAYLIEGAKDEIIPEIIKFCESIDIKTLGNPDFSHIAIDSLKIDEAFSIRAMSSDKAFSSQKRIFVITTNNITLDAQNVLLKMFEEPIDNTHFFVVVPDADSLLKTLVSRFYLISTGLNLEKETKEAENFIKMPLQKRIDFIKELLVEREEEDASSVAGLRPMENGNEMLVLDGTRSKALKFLNALESILHRDMSKTVFDIKMFEHFFKVREFLRMPGSSTKTLMESVALAIPIF